MNAQVSLHTGEPTNENEVSYKGYERALIVCDVKKLREEPLRLSFAVPHETMPGEITHICLTHANSSNLVIPILPHLKMEKGQPIRVTLSDIMTTEMLNPKLNPIAAVAYVLHYYGELKAEDLHPKLYEAINDSLQAAGLPVMKVTRFGEAHMTGNVQNIFGG